MKLILSLVFTIIVITATTITVSAKSIVQITDSTKTITIKVKGINCAMDLETISTNVEKLVGVSSCKSIKMGTTSKFDVKYFPSLVSKKEIDEAIENTGGCKNPNDRPYKVKQ
ncbi:MAG: heavy-metal-associated domain-containing protein [Bacteroidetes bacterium]|nr:heavy-metal-associated domain-containing protein [Bacteroidota bacterium]